MWIKSFLAGVLGLCTASSWANVSVTVEHVPAAQASPAFTFKNLPPLSPQNLATAAQFTLVDGARDGHGATLAALHDGKLARTTDDPASAFFLADGTLGGRVKIDLGKPTDIGAITTYSWHTDNRAPQVYRVFVSDGADEDFQANPRMYVDPAEAGWTLLASVDTRSASHGQIGGQYGVSIRDGDSGSLGTYRYILLDLSRTEADDPQSNTFYDEVEILSRDQAQPLPHTARAPATAPFDGHYAHIDTTGLDDDMQAWVRNTLQPTCDAWYPKLLAMLPSDGFNNPKTFTLAFRENPNGVPAYTLANHITCNLSWIKKNRDGEAVGAVIHEMVHVVQQYHFGRKSVPFWLQEGIPDYIRWYVFEPQKNGARIRNPEKVKYSDAYRVSANFLNWATQTYNPNLVKIVNAAVRQGKYSDDLWKTLTGGHTLDELNAQWKQSLGAKQPTTQAK